MSAIDGCGTECDDAFKALSKRGMKIGKGLQVQLQTGKVSEDRVANYEKEWTKKVECADEAHTRLYKLDVNEADRIMRNLEKFAAGGTPPACPEQRKQLLSCLKQNQNHTLKCNEEVEAFANCVDDMLLSTSRKAYTENLRSKKPSYTEKFQQVSA